VESQNHSKRGNNRTISAKNSPETEIKENGGERLGETKTYSVPYSSHIGQEYGTSMATVSMGFGKSMALS